jgi:hypothetical protein
MVAPLIVILNEFLDSLPELREHLTGYLVYLAFQCLMILLHLTFGLRVKWRRQNVLYPHQLKIITKSRDTYLATLSCNRDIRYSTGTWDSRLRRYLKPDLLLLDDFP